MRVILLDIDGVLCTSRSHLCLGKTGYMLDWDPVGCGFIREACKTTGAKLVISSTWRKDHNLVDLFPRLKEFGLWEHLYCDPGESDDWRTAILSSGRHYEISLWLNEHPVESFAIIDDNDVFHGQLKEKLVLTDFEDGISSKNYRDLMNLFGVKIGRILG